MNRENQIKQALGGRNPEQFGYWNVYAPVEWRHDHLGTYKGKLGSVIEHVLDRPLFVYSEDHVGSVDSAVIHEIG